MDGDRLVGMLTAENLYEFILLRQVSWRKRGRAITHRDAGLNHKAKLTTMPHRVVIIGGGFGGLYAAKALRRAPVEVTLIDRRNFHLSSRCCIRWRRAGCLQVILHRRCATFCEAARTQRCC